MSFVLGVLSSLVAAALVAGFLALRARRPLSTLRLAATVAPRMNRAGIANVFASRDEYARNRRPSSVTDYMATAEHELVYVGFWLAQASEIEPLRQTLRLMLDSGVRVGLVLLDPDMNEAQLERVASVLGLSGAALRARLTTGWGDLLSFWGDLPDGVASRLALQRHCEHLQASAFIFDRGHRSAKALIDIKLYGLGRHESLGLELRPPKRGVDRSLYGRVTRSFELVSERATSVGRHVSP